MGEEKVEEEEVGEGEGFYTPLGGSSSIIPAARSKHGLLRQKVVRQGGSKQDAKVG